ncbi:MAG: hypothetical protein DMF61_04905 [Blastocatellia bacterium AA13]|nr:MAG: hypothetical protein DMF61_04905 [Blastocatellia bacterium AA13]
MSVNKNVKKPTAIPAIPRSRHVLSLGDNILTLYMPSTHRVIRSLPAGHRTLLPGEEIDLSSSPPGRPAQLVQQGYVTPLPPRYPCTYISASTLKQTFEGRYVNLPLPNIFIEPIERPTSDSLIGLIGLIDSGYHSPDGIKAYSYYKDYQTDNEGCLTLDEGKTFHRILGFCFRLDNTVEIHLRKLSQSEQRQTGGNARRHSDLHPNIHMLLGRMNDALERQDFAGVLHASASVFETLAKEVVGIAGVQNQTLKSFFDRYRKVSGLPQALLDYVLAIYDRRNKVPLAGHGSTLPPDISRQEATLMAELTKAFVNIEYDMQRIRI